MLSDPIDRLYRHHRRHLLTTISGYIAGDDAEDVLQEVMIEVWRRSAQYDPARATVAGWATLIARCRARDALRARRCRPHGHTDADAPEVAGAAGSRPDVTAEAGRTRAALERELRQLRPEEQELVQLAFVDGFSRTEIAAQLGIPVGTVKSRLRAALAKLRGSVDPGFLDPTSPRVRPALITS